MDWRIGGFPIRVVTMQRSDNRQRVFFQALRRLPIESPSPPVTQSPINERYEALFFVPELPSFSARSSRASSFVTASMDWPSFSEAFVPSCFT